MSGTEMTVDSIIKKYEQRQEKLCHSIASNRDQQIDNTNASLRNGKNNSRGMETPQFNHKSKKISDGDYVQKTHKKNESYQTFNPNNGSNPDIYNQQTSKKEYQMLLVHLEQAQQKLIKSEKSYAELWKKYDLLSKKSGKSVQIQQKLRGKESSQLQERINGFEKEVLNLKNCINAKDENLSALRDKLKEKNHRMVQLDRMVQELTSELDMIKAQQSRNKEIEDLSKQGKDLSMKTVKEQINRFEKLLQSKEKEKLQLLLQFQRNQLSHRQETDQLKQSYRKMEEEYKQWIQNCKSQKLQMVQRYELKLKQSQNIITSLNSNSGSLKSLQNQLCQRNNEIGQLINCNTKLNNELKKIRLDFQTVQKTKQELMIKLCSVENSLIEKIDYERKQEDAYSKLQGLYRSQQEKNRILTEKYNAMNQEYQEIKNKYTIINDDMEGKKGRKQGQLMQIQRQKKENCRLKQQLEKSKINQITLNQKLNESLTILKTKNAKHDEEKQEMMTQLLAQRLQNVRLKDQLQQTKVNLKNQYDLSLENIKRQLQQKIRQNSQNSTNKLNSRICDDVQKQQLYLQLRQLQRRYQLMASEMVTVDEMVVLSAKAQKRYQMIK